MTTPTPPPVPQQPPQRKKGGCLRVFLILVGVFVGLFILLAIIGTLVGPSGTKPRSSAAGVNPTQVASNAEPPKAKQWTDVYTFKGNGMKKSPPFTLHGNEARLKYKYKTNAHIGTGMFAAYVVTDGEDIMKTGGIPEVMTQAEKEESETALQKSPGRYYLTINAVGNWVVTVQELR